MADHTSHVASMRAIHIFPDFSESGCIEAVRERFDPLAAHIQHHVTLVFPFQLPVSDEQVSEHVADVAKMFDTFTLGVGPAQAVDEDQVWLPVTTGASTVTKLHQSLYTGILAEVRNNEIPYQPHITIARVPADQQAEALQAAGALKDGFHTTIRHLVIERIAKDGSSQIVSLIPLGSL